MRQVQALETNAGRLLAVPDSSKPPDPAVLAEAAHQLESARTLLRPIPALETMNSFLTRFAAPRSARQTLPALWSVYLRLNRTADAEPLIGEALQTSRPFGDPAVQATLTAFAFRTFNNGLGANARHAVLEASRSCGPRLSLTVARDLCGTGSAFDTEMAEKALLLSLEVPDSHERAVTLEWYSRHREEAHFQMIMNPGRVAPAQAEAIVRNPFPNVWDQLLALCLKADEVALTADALGSQAVFQASTGHPTDSAATFTQAIEYAEGAGDFKKAAQTANRAAGSFPGQQLPPAARLEFVGRAVKAATSSNDALQLARALRVRALLSVGATNQSFQDLQDAVRTAERYTTESGDAFEEVQCLVALGNEHVARGEYQSAIGVLERAAEKGRPLRPNDSSILERITQIYSTYMGEPVLALQAAERTQRFVLNTPAVRAVNPSGAPNYNVQLAYARLAGLYRNLGQPTAALEAFAKALAPLAATANWLPNQRTWYGDRARYLTELGDYESALADWDKVLELMPATLRNYYQGNENLQKAVWLASVAHVHALAGDTEKALALARDAIGRLDKDTSGIPVERAAIDALVDIFLGANDPSTLLAFCESYYKRILDKPIADPVVERVYLETAARARVKAGEFEQARALLLSAVDIDRKQPTAAVGGLGGSLLALGNLELAAKNFAKAKQYLVDARAAVSPYDQERIWQIERALALALARVEDVKTASEHYDRALTALELVREKFRPEEFRLRYGKSRDAIYGENASVLAVGALRSGKTADAVWAFQAAERRRTQMLAGLLATGWSRVLLDSMPDQLRRAFEMEARLGAKRSLLMEQFSRPTHEQNAALVDRLQREERQLRDDHERLLVTLSQGQYRYAAPATLAAGLARRTQDALGPSRVLVEYLVTDERSYAFVVSSARVNVVPIAVGRAALREQVERLLRPFRQLRSGQVDLARLEYDSRQAYELHRAIFAPVRPLLGSATDVVIVPDDVLNFLPFEALVEAAPPAVQPSAALHGEYASQPFLLRRYTISYVPSAADLLPGEPAKQLAKPSMRLFAMANPTAGRAAPPPAQDDPLRRQLRSAGFGAYLAPLPGAEAEVERIARTFPGGLSTVVVGANATEEVYKAEAGKHAILHFAAHAIASDGQPLYSTLVLAPDAAKKDDGFLQAYEVLRTPLNADLVVLSGCETAVGSEDVGQGLVGLVAAFQQAGAKSVLPTLWSIDESTSEMMGAFYRAMGDGRTTAAALRQAKLQMLQQRVRMGKAEVSLAHPFFWAPFILVGAR
jgi:CHAT domain-containing protein